MVKKLVIFLAAAVMAFALAACGGSLGVESDDSGVHAKATGSAEGEANGSLTISEGYGLCINHVVEKGTFHVKATAKDGTVVFDDDISDNIANLVDADPGEYELWISAKGATGTVDVIPYDKAAQAQADATLDDAMEQATGKDAEELGLTNSNDADEE